jgi:hypothetical protein
MSIDQCPDDYSVIDNQNVNLTVTIGDGQIGSSKVKLNGQTLEGGEITNINVGLGKDIKGKKLTINTTVDKANPQTNKASITYDLSGGLKNISCTEKKEFGKDDSVILSRSFNFK